MKNVMPARVALLIPMLATSIDAEVIATRDALVRTLAAAGLGLSDLAAAISSPPEQRAEVGPAPSFFDKARGCRDLDCGRLTVIEKKFVGNMIRLGRGSPTPRQEAWLSDIYARLWRAAA